MKTNLFETAVKEGIFYVARTKLHKQPKRVIRYATNVKIKNKSLFVNDPEAEPLTEDRFGISWGFTRRDIKTLL